MIQQPISYGYDDQFRMSRLQIYNWGTFSGIHNIPISERGFLFVGRSGAGKSTLLDAFSALLVPPKWIDFNAAAREAARSGRDRNLVTYIRGAWAEQKDNDFGEITTQYLRTGTTWSALALTYQNALGKIVVLVQLFWLRGNATANTDVKKYYLIFQEPLNLEDLEDFGSHLDIRKLKQAFPQAHGRDDFNSYKEHFCRLLGIESEMALRLLHKTQSAKNLGDLNTFLRDFMLDKPATFEVAERLVNEFSELNAAHQSVVTAKEQVETLRPAKNEYDQFQNIKKDNNHLKQLRSSLDTYRDQCLRELIKKYLEALRIEKDGLSNAIIQQETIVGNEKDLLQAFEQQHRELGGDLIEQWQKEKKSLEIQREQRVFKRNQVKEACQKLEWPLPENPQAYSELTGKARQEVENWHESSERLQAQNFDFMSKRSSIEKSFAEVRNEIKALESQSSNIPYHMLSLRKEIAEALGVSESSLPFVGELLEVRQEESEWQGAIERVLHGFALSLLVDQRNYTALSKYINSVHIGSRLVYYRTGKPEFASLKSVPANSLVNKLNIKKCSHSEWLRADLNQRFDYACVDSQLDFRNTSRALTREGQIRHSVTRHEKDDRYKVDDRRHWVLGFNNKEKLLLFKKQAQELAASIHQLNLEIKNISDQSKQSGNRLIECQTLVNISWHEIDVAPLLSRISNLERQLEDARKSNTTLNEVDIKIKSQIDILKKAENKLIEYKAQLQKVEKDIAGNSQKFSNLPQEVHLEAPLANELASRVKELDESITLDNLDKILSRIERNLGIEIEKLESESHQLEKTIENRFSDFKRYWPVDAGNMDITLASAPDYFAVLQRLETDGLAAYEQHFYQLLRDQSQQNLAALSTHLTQARKAIMERMELVNESLGQAEFNPGTYLHIEASDRNSPDVREFRQDIQQALNYAWAEDAENAEHRFQVLRQMVGRLASQDAEQRRWRESVLDVRLHVEFIARELDSRGNEIEIYRSGAGKSGGQRQKLATTCLAAALRYQLGGNDYGVPVYAPVVLDEAFDKADNEFTSLAMNIFANFGFQMIVATPLKSVMTLEPFIGGACFVDISDRKHSSVLLIEYDTERKRLNLPESTNDISTLPIAGDNTKQTYPAV